jgi:hypothetical protein
MWHVPLTVDAYINDDTPVRLRYMLEKAHGAIDLPDGCIGCVVNPDRKGYYRVSYGSSLDDLLTPVLDLQAISPLVRAGALSDLYALAKKGECSFSAVTDFIQHWIKNDYDPVVLRILCSILNEAFLVLPQRRREEIRALSEITLLPAFERLAGAGEKATLVEKTTRIALVSVLIILGTVTVEDRLFGMYESLVRGDEVDSDFVPSAWRIGARRDPDGAFRAMRRLIREAKNEQTKVTISGALGGFSDHSVLEESLEFAKTGVAEQNRHTMFGAIGSNPDVYPFFRQWIAENLDYFKDFHMYLYERSLYTTLPYAFVGAEESVDGFADTLTAGNRREAEDSITLVRELLAVNSSFAAREG